MLAKGQDPLLCKPVPEIDIFWWNNTHVRWEADQHMNVIWASFRLDDLHLHLIAQLSQDFSDVLLDLVVYYLPAILWCKHHMILASVT